MRDIDRTKKQLIDELTELRQRVAEFGASETERKRAEHDLNERIKELNTLYRTGDIAQRPGITLDELFQEVANLLPTGWQYPENTCARITINDKEFRSKNYRETGWKQSSDITVSGEKIGTVEVGYLEERPAIDEGPFSKEERQLINSIAERLGRITERKQVEEELRESEKNFRLLAENSNDGIRISYLYGEDTAVAKYVNRKLQELTGYSERELLNHPILTIVHPSERDRIADIRKRRLAGEPAPQHYETVLLTKDGKSIPVEITASGTIWQGQSAVMVVHRDITERKRAEEALRESEENFRQLAENSNDAIAISYTDKDDWERVYVNSRFQELTGYAKKEALSLSILMVIHPNERDRIADIRKRRLAGEPVPRRYETVLLTKDGKSIPAEITASSTVWQGQSAVMVVYRDITERKQAEEALRLSEERYRALLELGGNVGEAIVMLQDTEQGNAIHVFVSDEWPRMTGYSRKELLGMSFFDLLHSKDREASLERHQRKIRGEIIPGLFEMSVIRKDGTEVPIELTSAYTTYKGERANVAFIRDITERKQAEDREKELQQELGLSSRLAAVGELAAGIAHEINNPLTGILGFSERLLRKSTDEKEKQGLETIHNEAQRAARVVQNLLTFARRCGPEKEYSDVNDILQSALELRAYELETSSIEVVTDLAPSLPGIMADYNQIEEVFLNIILNAEQVMTEANGGGKLTIKTQQMKDYVRTSFADDGPGIPAEQFGKVFDPFFTTRGERGGTGLGLSVCHGIVTDHGGRIYARSKPGKGATFFVELPCR